jgi:hypothetical protein
MENDAIYKPEPKAVKHLQDPPDIEKVKVGRAYENLQLTLSKAIIHNPKAKFDEFRTNLVKAIKIVKGKDSPDIPRANQLLDQLWLLVGLDNLKEKKDQTFARLVELGKTENKP